MKNEAAKKAPKPGKGGQKYVPYAKRTGLESIVYFTRDLSPEGLLKVFDKIEGALKGRIAVKLSDAASLTYERYQSEIKPKKPAPAETKGWRCTVCGYIYEGEELPADFVCPVCKHGAEVFEKI